MPLFTVEWGSYQYKNGKIIAQIQDGDIELRAETEEDAIRKAPIPKSSDWHHAYLGPSKWL